MDPNAAVREALDVLSPEDVRRRLDERYGGPLLERFAASVKACLALAPEVSRDRGLVSLARKVLTASPESRLALTRDPALGRWTSAMEQTLESGQPSGVPGLLLLLPRLAVGVAVLEGVDLDTTLVTGSGGRARVPVDGRILAGPPGRSIRLQVRSGEVVTHGKPATRVGPFELVSGDAEGGRIPSVRPQTGTDLFTPGTILGKAVRVLEDTAPSLLGECAALAPALVPLATDEDVSQSAGLAGARGCIWMSFPPRPLVVAETLIHETSHQLFFLVEDACLMVQGDDPPRLAVPWRTDPRPLRAVLMGLHAWVRVLRWLRSLEGTPLAQAAQQRVEILEPAVTSAVEIAGEASDGLTDAGRALHCALEAASR
jgi:HEXXH motif-containing protein